ncbi:MAG: sulfotransferase, partial [Myxococcales bacterium]|nr:sulfotransferase [Myxococcales bacterium]
PGQLVLKNPINTGRIPLLRELYPNAKFIYMHRDPYTVFVSMRNFYESVLPLVRLQEVTREEIEELVLRIYREILGAYLQDRKAVPSSHLVEVNFEDLERNPVAEMRRIYDTLNLGEFPRVEPALQAYMEGQAGYEKNRFARDPEDVRKVNQNWGFAFDAWGNARIEA